MSIFKSLVSSTEKNAAKEVFQQAQTKGAERLGKIRGAENALRSNGMVTASQAVQGLATSTFGGAAIGGAIGSMNMLSQEDSFGAAKSGAAAGALVGGLMGGRRFASQAAKGKIVGNNAINQLASGRKGIGDLKKFNTMSAAAGNAFGWSNVQKGMKKMSAGNMNKGARGGVKASQADEIVRGSVATSPYKKTTSSGFNNHSRPTINRQSRPPVAGSFGGSWANADYLGR